MSHFKHVSRCAVLLLGPLAAASFGQVWYVGAIGGYGYAPGVTVKSSSGSATTGFESGRVAGAFLGADDREYWSGELRYLNRQSNLKLESGGTSAHFTANTNIVTGNLLVHLQRREANLRTFVIFGAGVRVLDGTGAESASQPLGRFAALTHTRESLLTADVGFGVKTNFRKRLQFRAEVHDYVGPAPSKVIAAAPGATMGGWLNDIIATASIAYLW